MIKESELRIGNYLLIYGDPAPIQIGWFLAYSRGCLPSHQPIPLTEEWLRKLGFEWVGDKLHFKGIRISANCIFWHAGLEHPQLTISGPLGTTCLKYVHQLQNWYFALTGEELTIKETA